MVLQMSLCQRYCLHCIGDVPAQQIQFPCPVGSLRAHDGCMLTNERLEMDGSGSVRVVSKRKGGVEPAMGEMVVDVDRTHPILGNHYVLKNFRATASAA